MCSVTLGSYIYSIYPIKVTEKPTWLSRIKFPIGNNVSVGSDLEGFISFFIYQLSLVLSI